MTEQATLWDSYMQVLNEVPNFITDETAQAGNRTYKYLNLATILKNIKPIFAKHNIGFYQMTDLDGAQGNVTYGTVTTVIFNATERESVCRYPFVVTGDPQQVGSAVTYARRYSLYAILGIFPDKDDDGAYAHDAYNRPPTINEQQAMYLVNIAKGAGLNLQAIAKEVTGRNIQRLGQLTTEEAKNIENAILNH